MHKKIFCKSIFTVLVICCLFACSNEKKQENNTEKQQNSVNIENSAQTAAEEGSIKNGSDENSVQNTTEDNVNIKNDSKKKSMSREKWLELANISYGNLKCSYDFYEGFFNMNTDNDDLSYVEPCEGENFHHCSSSLTAYLYHPGIKYGENDTIPIDSKTCFAVIGKFSKSGFRDELHIEINRKSEDEKYRCHKEDNVGIYGYRIYDDEYKKKYSGMNLAHICHSTRDCNAITLPSHPNVGVHWSEEEKKIVEKMVVISDLGRHVEGGEIIRAKPNECWSLKIKDIEYVNPEYMRMRDTECILDERIRPKYCMGHPGMILKVRSLTLANKEVKCHAGLEKYRYRVLKVLDNGNGVLATPCGDDTDESCDSEYNRFFAVYLSNPIRKYKEGDFVLKEEGKCWSQEWIDSLYEYAIDDLDMTINIPVLKYIDTKNLSTKKE